MKINDRVYVSLLSTSRLAGEVGIVRAISARGEVKVENDFGVIGYPNIRHCKVNNADAPVSFTRVVDDIAKAVPSDPAKPHSNYVCDEDVSHSYLTSIQPIKIGSPQTQKEIATYLNKITSIDVSNIPRGDLLTRAVVFRDFFTGAAFGGFVSDQWIEDGVELLNIVYDGTFSVVPRSMVICTMKHVPDAGPKAYIVDSYI